jgi:hypothetical protein
MLIYVDKGRGIRIYRPAAKDSRERPQLLATIEKRRFSVRAIPDANATEEEAREIETFASDLKDADPDRKAAVLQFPASAANAIAFYGTKATDIDKQLISGAVRWATRAIRKQAPLPAPSERPVKPSQSTSPSPEALAGALYKILSLNVTGKVSGKPGTTKRTKIAGSCDLMEIARALLASA